MRRRGGGAQRAGMSTACTPLGHPPAPILAYWRDNRVFLASTPIGFTVIERYSALKLVVARGKASRMPEVLEKRRP